MTYPLVRDLTVDGIPVVVTCWVLGLSTQGFYRWCANSVSQRHCDDAHLINAAIDIHADDPEFGYRFVAISSCTARRSGCSGCALHRITSSILCKRRGSSKTPGPPVHDDHVQLDLPAEALDEI